MAISWTAAYSSRLLISLGATPDTMAEASCGHSRKKNSHRPSAQSAEVAV